MTNPPDNRTLSETDIETVVEQVMGGKKNVILDATILTALMTCARLADFRFNHNLVSIQGKSNSLECGSIVHTFLEFYYGSMIKGLARDKAFQYGITAAELYIKGCPHCTLFISTPEQPHPSCNHHPNQFPGLRNTPREDEGYKIGWQWVLDTVDQYHIFYKNDHWVPLEVETVKGEVLYEDEEVRILWKAKLDWVADTNQGIYPIDHKSMKQRRNNLSLNNQFIGQCLVMKTRNMFINKIGFQKSLKPEEKFERKPIGYSIERLLEWQSETLPFYAKLLLMYAETGHFPPNFSNCEGKYGNCNFSKVCESNPDMREEEIKKMFVVGPVWDISSNDDKELVDE